MWSEMPEWQRQHLTTVLRMRARPAAGPAPTREHRAHGRELSLHATANSCSRLLSGPQRVVLHCENVFYADADPVHRVTTYIPWPIAEGTSLLNPEVGHPYGIHGILEERGHTMTRLRQEVSARMPTADEVQLLRLSPGVPVLDMLNHAVWIGIRGLLGNTAH